MNYTESLDHSIAKNGQPMHDDHKPISSVFSGNDANMLIWSLMEVVKSAQLSGLTFNPDDPNTYTVFLKALQKLFAGSPFVEALAQVLDSHVKNTSNPHQTTAAQVGADPAGAADQAVASHEAKADPHSQYLTQAEGDQLYMKHGDNPVGSPGGYQVRGDFAGQFSEFNDTGHTVLYFFSGGAANGNRYQLSASVDGVTVLEAHDSNPEWSKAGSLTVACAPGSTVLCTSNPHQEGAGTIHVVRFVGPFN